MWRSWAWLWVFIALDLASATQGDRNAEEEATGADCGCSAGLSRELPVGSGSGATKSSEADDLAKTGDEVCGSEPEATAARDEAAEGEGEGEGEGDMVFVEAGEFRFGTDTPFIIPDGEGPGRITHLSGYYIDRFMVTNEKFGEFVGNTSYKTDSEKYGWSFVFLPMLSKRQQREIQQAVAGMEWWLPVEGAYWRRPEGPQTDVYRDGRRNHPATHVSWNDASAYCRWRGGRLPSEAEWERAAQGGGTVDGRAALEDGGVPRYPWGDELTPGGQHRANVWQGTFPTLNVAEDGFPYTSPVGAFPAQNSLGLRDAVGNAWEWVEDWWTPDRSNYKMDNPRGPKRGTEKTKKGGSFLCHHTYCYRYRPAARTKSDIDSGTSNQGFRCAADGKGPRANGPSRRDQREGGDADAAAPARVGGSSDVEEQATNIGGERLLTAAGNKLGKTSGTMWKDGVTDGEPDFSRETYDAIRADIEAALTDSQDFWPADFGNYGGLMIRLAWHCAGSYRSSDGRGGCDGGRIRFFPERGWIDNANLDKALTILQPIKLKYGDAITWADLIILTGDVSIVSMGGPSIGFCAGRLDDDNGFDSLELGPTPEQEATAPCPVNGTCEVPLGTSTVGLIYVNPEGPEGVPDPALSALQVREVFERMGMNDSETVALIGGGHAFGKCHGACPTGPGPDPFDAPEAPWPGTCGDPDSPTFGRAENTFTSGFEGAWTEEPTVWDNSYFKALLAYDWIQEDSPGGPIQWIPVPMENATDTDVPDIIMLTADIALIFDEVYLPIVELFAADQAALDVAFSEAWYKLVTRDMGPHVRCEGTDVPAPRDFQLPLPDAPEELPSYTNIKWAIGRILTKKPSYASLFVTLAYRCAATFRSTDLIGGCNGARIRFPPQSEWEVNTGLDEVLDLLEPVKETFPDIPYADLIVLAANVALRRGASLPTLSFCKGRVDAEEDDPNHALLSILEPLREYETVIIGVRDRMKIAGLTVPQMVALAGRPRSTTYMINLGFSGSYAEDTGEVSNTYYKLLLTETWEEVPGSDGEEYQSVDTPGVYVLATDLALVWDPVFKAQVVKYAEDNDEFLYEFGKAWTALMNADRFDGSRGNVCY
eukprot:g3151.t1